MIITITPLSQRDPRWKDQRLGMKNGTTIGSDGCVITSASMLYTYYGKPTTPDQLDNFLTDNGLQIDLVTGTGTDENVVNGFTGGAVKVTSTKTLTTSWVNYTMTTSTVMADTINQIGFQFIMTPTGTAGANDWFEITQVQLCAGDVALPFQPKSEAQEKLDCWRYAFKAGSDTSGYSSIASGNCTATTSASALIVFPVRMRTAPTSTYPTANTLGVTAASGAAVVLTAIADDSLTDYSARVYCTTASGLTAGNATNLIKYNSTSTILFSAEL